MVSRLQDEANRRVGQTDMARDNVRTAEEELDLARAVTPDASLAGRRQESEQKAAEAEALHQTRACELAAADPDSAASLLTNARGVLQRLRDGHGDLELESARIKTELEVRGEAGLHDRHSAVASELVRGERQKALIDRRAAAAELLYARLAANRDAAKRAYALPFKQQLDAYARIVFGSTVSLNVDYDTLQIAGRTLDGVTVPYDSLSAGAKEQLCVLSRLACAHLVSPTADDQSEAGVPVIFDDALGYSDPGRLERIGAAFNAASGHSQIVVLTCVPERYRNIGSATVVQFGDATRAPAGV